MHQGIATMRRGKGKCKTFFMIKKNQCASDSSIILCNVYFLSYHFIPNCIATTFSFPQSFLVSLVGGETWEATRKLQFYFLSSCSNLNKSGGNFSSWFCKNSGAAWQCSGVTRVEAGGGGGGGGQDNVSGLSISHWLAVSGPNILSWGQNISKMSSWFSIYLFTSRPGD